MNIITNTEHKLTENFMANDISDKLIRKSEIFKKNDIFRKMKGEHEILRYITRLGNKDVTLCDSMIPLGSCTMKLNSAY